MTLNDLLERKATGVITIKASTGVIDAVEIMCDHKIGSLLVEADDGALIGILTERDILLFCSRQKGNLADTTVDQAMTRDIIVATPETGVDEAMSLMTEHRFRHLPIIENGRPAGIISIGDLLKAQLKDVSVEVKYLRDYINA
jgi:CBS domain-containing protein